MYLVHSRADEHRFPGRGPWFRQAIRHLVCADPHPANPRLHYLDGLTGRLGGAYRQGRARELELAWRDGEISYRVACDELEELDGEP